MAFFLRNKSAHDEDDLLRIRGMCTVGRAPSSDLRLDSEEVAWEHAVFAEQAGKLYVAPGSTAGLIVDGELVQERTAISKGAVIRLTDGTELDVVERASDEERDGLTPMEGTLIAVILVILGGLGIAMLSDDGGGSRQQSFTLDQYRRVHRYLAMESERWLQDEELALDMQAAFEKAFEEEMIFDSAGAQEQYTAFLRASVVAPVPGSSEATVTMAEAAILRANALDAVAKSVLGFRGAQDLKAYTDLQLSAAMVQFVRRGASRTSQ